MPARTTPSRLRVGVLGVVLALAATVLTGSCTPLVGGSDLHVTALFDDSAGLFVGNDVGVLGVPVGKVTRITPAGDVVEVELEIDGDTDLPATAGAVVVARSVATDRYVELTPAFGDGPRMEDGATIPLEQTRTPVEFDEVLASLEQFSTGLLGKDGQAAAISELLHSGAQALDGRGTDLHDTLRDLSKAAGAIASHRDDIAGTIGNLDDLTTLVAANRALVDQFIRSITDATDLFADERHSFGRSLTALSRALESLAGFVQDNRALLRSDLPRLTRVVDRLLERRRELEETVEVLPLALTNVGNGVGADDRLNVKIPPTDLSPIAEQTDALCARLPFDLCSVLGTDPSFLDLLEAIVGGLQP